MTDDEIRNKIRVGFVAGIKYNSEGKIIEWLYGKNDLTGYGERVRLFKTEKQAQNYISKRGHAGVPFVRPFYHYTKSGVGMKFKRFLSCDVCGREITDKNEMLCGACKAKQKPCPYCGKPMRLRNGIYYCANHGISDPEQK